MTPTELLPLTIAIYFGIGLIHVLPTIERWSKPQWALIYQWPAIWIVAIVGMIVMMVAEEDWK